MLQLSGEYIPPQDWVTTAEKALQSRNAFSIGADRLFFTGGEPTCSLPWVEKVCSLTEYKINFDTNGFITLDSLKRIIKISDSITYDIKAFTDKVHHLLTGASIDPVLRNIEYITGHGFDKLYEVRVLVHPGLVEEAAKILTFATPYNCIYFIF